MYVHMKVTLVFFTSIKHIQNGMIDTGMHTLKCKLTKPFFL